MIFFYTERTKEVYNNEPNYGNAPMVCRICFDSETDRDLLTVPCLCAGSNKYIHKTCLDRWRATNQNPYAFTHCPTCKFEYHLEEIVKEKPVEGNVCGCIPARCCSRKSRFRLLVTRDFLVGFLVVQLWLITLAVLIRLMDPDEKLVELFPLDNADRAGLKNALYHHKATYYFTAVLVTFFLLGIYASCCSPDPLCASNTRGPDCGPCDCGNVWCYWGDCDCAGAGGSSAGEECAAVFLVIAAIVALIFVFIGIFFGIMAIVAWIQRVVQRHIHILHLKELAREFVVVDLEKAGRLRYANRESAPVPSAPAEIQIIHSNNFPEASAPPEESVVASSRLRDELSRMRW